MSIVRKSDIKNHLSARYRKGIHLAKPGSDLNVASELDTQAGTPTNFTNDFQSEHSSVEKATAPKNAPQNAPDSAPNSAPHSAETDSMAPQAPAASKSAEA